MAGINDLNVLKEISVDHLTTKTDFEIRLSAALQSAEKGNSDSMLISRILQSLQPGFDNLPEATRTLELEKYIKIESGKNDFVLSSENQDLVKSCVSQSKNVAISANEDSSQVELSCL